MLSYGEREQRYRRRLLIIAPIAAFLVSLVFLTSDVTKLKDVDKYMGWEGELQLLPEVTIIPDVQHIEDAMESSSLKTLASMDVDILNEKAGEAPGGQNEQVEEVEPDEVTQPEIDDADVRHFEQHAEIPYSDDFVILYMVKPDYPPREMLAGIEGEVTVEILVNEEGTVENAWVLNAFGPKSFEHASLAAVKQFLFKPPIVNGVPVPMWIRFQVKFRLV